MSAPLIWIVIPLFLAVGLYLIRQNERIVASIGTFTCLTLVGLALLMPVDEPIQFGPLAFKIATTMNILGRQLIISSVDMPAIILIYSVAAFWFGGVQVSKVTPLFVPIGLAMISCLIAALAVEPFLYAALLIEVAVLLSIPMMSEPGMPTGKGALRYLIFQTLAMPFILFTGWMLTGVESGSADLQLVARAAIMLGLGFAFLLAIFPFYTWIPLLAEDIHPYISGFILLLLPTVSLLFGLKFLDRYAWLRDPENLHLILSLTGILMVFTGGVWAAFQTNLARLFGYAVIIEIGLSLLAISLGSSQGMYIFSNLFLPRIVSLAAWALGMSVLREHVVSFRFESLRGIARSLPFATLGIIAAEFSLAGVPLLAGFPTRQALWEEFALQSPETGIWVFLGSMGFMIGVLRSLIVFATGMDKQQRKISETSTQRLLLGIGIFILFGIGLFPQLIAPLMNDLVKAYLHLL